MRTYGKNNYGKILKLFIKDMFRRRGKKQTAIIGILAFAYIMIMASVVLIVALVSPQVAEQNKTAEFLTMFMFIDFALTVILGTVAAVSYLFLSKDAQFFLGLPVKPSTVFLAKLTVVYLTELVISVGILLPAFITCAAVTGLPWVFYLIIPVAVLAVPVFAMMLIALVSMPIVLFISHFKNRGVVMSIVAIVLFTGIMSLYLWFVMGSNPAMGGGTGTDINGFLNVADGISKVFYPLYMLMNFGIMANIFGQGTGMSMLIEFGIFAGALAAIFFISYFLSLAVYNKLNSRMLENRSNTSGKKGDYAAVGITKALIKREWRGIVRNPMVAMNTLGGLIIGPLITVMMVYFMSKTFSTIDGSGELSMLATPAMFWSLVTIFSMAFGVILNGSNTSISREGQSFYFMKMLPLTFKQQIKAKHLFYTGISTAVNLLTAIAVTVTSLISNAFIWWAPILIFINAELWTYAIAALAIWFDLKSPILDWKSVREVTKRLKNSVVVLIWTFGSMIAGAVLLAVCLISGNGELLLAAGLTVYVLLGLGAAFLFHYVLYSSTDRLFRQVEC